MLRALALSGETPPDWLLPEFPAGVGLVRGEYLQRGIRTYITRPAAQRAMIDYLVATASRVAGPVWYRTTDLEAREAATLDGVEDPIVDPVPMLGTRGIRRGLRFPDTLRIELDAFAAAQADAPNLRLMFPFVSAADEAAQAREAAVRAGVRGPFGLMAETPAAVVTLDDLLAVGFAHVVVGCNDLWSLTMARANVAGVYPSATPALQRMIELARESTARAGASLFVAGYLDPSLVAAATAAGADAAVFHYSQLPKLLGPRYAGLPELDRLARIKAQTRADVAASAAA